MNTCIYIAPVKQKSSEDYNLCIYLLTYFGPISFGPNFVEFRLRP